MFQSVIDDMYGRFVRLVAESRNIPEARVRSFADGRIYTAEQARALGLVDRVGYLDEAIEMAKGAAGLTEARVVMYHRPREYRANMYSGHLGQPRRGRPAGSACRGPGRPGGALPLPLVALTHSGRPNAPAGRAKTFGPAAPDAMLVAA